MAKTILYALLLLSLCICVQAISFTEILYNPMGSDDGKEFVEVLGNNLEDYLIADSSSNDSLQLLQYVEGNLSIIVEDNFNYTNLNCSVYSAGSTIGNNLNNAGDSLYLFNHNGTLQTNTSYADIADEGNSIVFEERWAESVTGGTPCALPTYNVTVNNSINNSQNLTNETVNETNTTNNTNSSINLTQNTTSCLFNLSLTTSKTIFQNKEQIAFYNRLNDTAYDYSIEYWIEDAQGTIVKDKRTTSNLNKKTYTPSIKEADQVLFLRNRLVFVDCNTSNILENSVMVVVVNGTLQEPSCPSCSSCPVCEQNSCPSNPNPTQSSTVIHSFYTRTKQPDQTVKVFANIEPSVNSSLYLYAVTLINHTTLLSKKETYTFSAPVNPGNNSFLLRVEDGKYETTKTLSIFKEIPKKINESIKVQQELTLSPPLAPELSLITGKSAEQLYESKNFKVKNYLKYALVIVISLGIVITVKTYHDRKNKHKRKNRRRMDTIKNPIRNSRKTQRTHSQKS